MKGRGVLTTLTDEQGRGALAIRDWLRSSGPPCFSLTGLAGTGKTTTIAALEGEVVPEGTPVLALTGKATAALLRKGQDAATIHSAIYRAIVTDRGIRWAKRTDLGDRKKPLAIVDEASMINADILADLRERFDRVLLVGDHGQLPPIKGAGVLESVEGYRLSKVMRQALDSGILRTALALRKGEPVRHALAKGGADVSARMPEAGEIEGGSAWSMDEATMITARNVDRVALNRSARRAALGQPEDLLVEGDRILCLSNQPNGWINGMVGDVLLAEPYDGLEGYEAYKVYARCDDGLEREAIAIAEQLDSPKTRDDISFALWHEGIRNGRAYFYARGWCLTAHKAQGSEWRSVVVYGDGFGSSEDRAAWRYTAATRAAERLFWVGV